MCGLTGFISVRSPNAKTNNRVGVRDRSTYMRQTLIVDSLRGFHGTGVFYGHEDNDNSGWAKAAVQGAEFVVGEHYAEVEAHMDTLRFCVGHNRWATTGAADAVDNTHPFKEGPITMVHNGTLDGAGGLLTSQASLKVAVDSHAICHNLKLHDAVDVLAALDGAFCLIWHDKRDDSVNFVRNYERPLWMWTRAHGDTMYFGSERKMMEWILDRNHMGIGTYTTLPVGKIYKYLPGAVEPEITEVPLVPQYTGGYGTGYGAAYGAVTNRNHSWPPGNGAAAVSMGSDTVKKDEGPGTTTRINGEGFRRTTVPQEVEEVLNVQAMSGLDRLPFVPILALHGVVTGTIQHLDMPCFVIGITAGQCNANLKNSWCIRPVGIRMVPKDGKEEAVVMARIVSYYYRDAQWEYGAAWDGPGVDSKGEYLSDITKEVVDTEKKHESLGDSGEKNETGNGSNPWDDKPRHNFVESLIDETDDIPFDIVTESVDDVDYGLRFYAGPLGQMLTATEWLHATITGCSVCRRSAPLEDHEAVAWLDDGSDNYLCGDCAYSHL